MDARSFIAANGLEQAIKIIAAPYPILGWCCVGHNFIHKQSEAAPTCFSNADNSWSEEYAIELVRCVDLKFLMQQIIDKAPASEQYCQYYSPKQQTYYGYCDSYGEWYEWMDLPYNNSRWSKIYLPEQLGADRMQLKEIRQALLQCQ